MILIVSEESVWKESHTLIGLQVGTSSVGPVKKNVLILILEKKVLFDSKNLTFGDTFVRRKLKVTIIRL